MISKDQELVEYYIPYKFHDSKESYNTTVFCRGVKEDDYKSFNLPNSQCVIVKPFVYDGMDEDNVIDLLKRYLNTDYVNLLEEGKYLVKNYDIEYFKEEDYMSSILLSDYYKYMIPMNKRRFFDLFTSTGEWTNKRSLEYNNSQNHHIIITYNKSTSHLMYKQVNDKDFQILSSKQWKEMMDDIDVIFIDMSKYDFEEIVVFEVPSRIDFAQVSKEWNRDHSNLYSWYISNIEDLYKLSFISSRNLSDIVRINDKNGWKKLVDDILLSIDIDLYNSPVVSKFKSYYCIPGKYSNIYVYHLGDILLKFMELSNCPFTLKIWKFFKDFGKWNHIILNVFNRYILNRIHFTIPDQCVYMDEQYIFTYEPIDNFIPVNKIDYIITLAENSYITFNNFNKKSIFHGTHPISKPLFLAVNKAIENYMLCHSRNFDVNIDAITDMTDKNKTSLSIPITINKYNLDKYRDILDSNMIEDFELNKTIKENVNIWLLKSGEISSKYMGEESISASGEYIRNILNKLDNL